MSERRLPQLTEETFERTVAEGGLCVVEFYADWCTPCGMMEPVLLSLSDEYAGRVRFYRADADVLTELAERCDVTTLPCVLLFDKGELKDRTSGAKTRQSLKDRIECALRGE